MTRFERFGFLRVLTAGLFVWLVVDLHLVLVALEVLLAGVAGVVGWRWIGDELRRRRDWRRVR